jgi:gliding motility-associated-like protein
MNKAILSMLGMMVVIITQGQINLDRQVISCFAFNACEEFCVQSTAGQVDYIVTQDSGLHATHGFEQPDGSLSISLTIDLKYFECEEKYEAVVQNLSGCTQNEEVFYFWNGVEGESSNVSLDALTNLEVYTTNGCSYSASYNFEEMEFETIPCDLVFYNYLTPNGDGDNDEWRIENITDSEYSVNEVTFYNRWGAAVWNAKNYDNTINMWCGKSSGGELLPDGTYFYVVKTGGREYNGYVELLR